MNCPLAETDLSNTAISPQAYGPALLSEVSDSISSTISVASCSGSAAQSLLMLTGAKSDADIIALSCLCPM